MESRNLGENIELRPLRESDADELFQLTDRNRERLRRWLPWVDGTRRVEDTEAFIRRSRKAHQDREGLDCAVLRNGRIVGVAGFHRWDHGRRSAEFGYWLGEEAEGQGLMARAITALCDHAFQEMQLHRVEIRCAVRNERSRALAMNLGFREEGTIQEAEVVNGVWLDDVVYGFLKREWQEKCDR